MEVKLVADIHGEVEALRQAITPEDTLIILGDLLNWVDFKTLDGMLAGIMDKKEIADLLAEITSGRLEEAKSKAAFLEVKEVHDDKLRNMARKTYEELFSAITCKAYAIYGNVDYPDIMKECVTSNISFIESDTIVIGGTKFGFVSGVPPFKWAVGMPGEVDKDVFRRRINGLGGVDVLCTHIPPAYEELTFDIMANRSEEGSKGLADYVEAHQPEYTFFGHVHSPRKREKQAGRTKLINTGYFRREKKIYSLHL